MQVSGQGTAAAPARGSVGGNSGHGALSHSGHHAPGAGAGRRPGPALGSGHHEATAGSRPPGAPGSTPPSPSLATAIAPATQAGSQLGGARGMGSPPLDMAALQATSLAHAGMSGTWPAAPLPTPFSGGFPSAAGQGVGQRQGDGTGGNPVGSGVSGSRGRGGGGRGAGGRGTASYEPPRVALLGQNYVGDYGDVAPGSVSAHRGGLLAAYPERREALIRYRSVDSPCLSNFNSLALLLPSTCLMIRRRCQLP
jgi:hypothetical protein